MNQLDAYRNAPFHAALTAFEIQFEKELADRWERLEYAAADAIFGSPSSSEKNSFLNRFFDDAREQVAGAVHLYFPKLLQVATKFPQYLITESPVAWTSAQVWTQVCNFLGMDEKFDHSSSELRDDSRVLRSALRISTNTGCSCEDTSPAPLLPAWVGYQWLMRAAIGRSTDAASYQADAEPLSLAETRTWARSCEFQMYRKLEQQIEDEGLEGVIEAGKTGALILKPFVGEGDVRKRQDRRITSTQMGRVDLGKTIDTLYDELRRLKTFGRGRRKTESELRSGFPKFLLWKEIDASVSLPKLKKERFFGARLDSYRREPLMDFIGSIIALEGGSAYTIWKKYRAEAGLTRKRKPSRARSKSPF